MTNPTPAERESIVSRLRAQATWVPNNLSYGRVADVMREAADMLDTLSTEPEYEYGWRADETVRSTMNPRGPRIQWDGYFGTPEQIAEFPRGQRIRRRKAGPVEDVSA